MSFLIKKYKQKRVKETFIEEKDNNKIKKMNENTKRKNCIQIVNNIFINTKYNTKRYLSILFNRYKILVLLFIKYICIYNSSEIEFI